MSVKVLDAETTTSKDHIWMVDVYYPDTDEHRTCYTPEQLAEEIQDGDTIIAHNGIDFDKWVIEDVWKFEWPEVAWEDTLVMSRLWCPTLSGGHSLKAWGERLGTLKGDFTDYDGPPEGESYQVWMDRMLKYCRGDTKLTWRLHVHLMKVMRKDRFTRTSFNIEMRTAAIVSTQVRNGLWFDIDQANVLYSELTAKSAKVKAELQEEFPPIVTERWSEKQVDSDGNPKRLKDHIEVFNPGSHVQVAKRLVERGVKLTERTETGNYRMSEEILAGIDHPAAEPIKYYQMLEKRISQMNQWFQYYDENTHRIHGGVNSTGTVTFRMTHARPNLAQIPSCGKPYGPECRRLFRAPPGKKFLGCDASGLELRLFANALGSAEYVDVVVNGDAHQHHADALGIDRRTAKMFIYAFIYGAGNGKLGQIIGGNLNDGREARELFETKIPGLMELTTQIKDEANATGFVRLIDGRPARVRSDHSALNFRLQGDGAIVMKAASIRLWEHIAHWNPVDMPMQVVQAHDEWQFEVVEENADHLGHLAVGSIVQAGQDFEMICPLDGEYIIGDSWAETH